MTNAEKYKEVFGFAFNIDAFVDGIYCPLMSTRCGELPCRECIRDYWNSEYSGEPTIPLSVKEALEKEIDSFSRAYKEEHEKWKSLMLAIEKIKAEIILMSDKADRECKVSNSYSVRDRLRTKAQAYDDVAKLIDGKIKEYTHK